MGYLTPILISNDDLDIIENHPEQIKNIVLDASRDSKAKSFSLYKKIKKKFGFGEKIASVSSNSISSLGTSHSSSKRLIAISGGTWVDLSRLIHDEWAREDETYIKYIEECIKVSQTHLTELKSVLKEKKRSLRSKK